MNKTTLDAIWQISGMLIMLVSVFPAAIGFVEPTLFNLIIISVGFITGFILVKYYALITDFLYNETK